MKHAILFISALTIIFSCNAQQVLTLDGDTLQKVLSDTEAVTWLLTSGHSMEHIIFVDEDDLLPTLTTLTLQGRNIPVSRGTTDTTYCCTVINIYKERSGKNKRTLKIYIDDNGFLLTLEYKRVDNAYVFNKKSQGYRDL